MSIWDSAYSDAPTQASPSTPAVPTSQAKKSFWDSPYSDFQVDTSSLPQASRFSEGEKILQGTAGINGIPNSPALNTADHKGEEAGGLDAFAPTPRTQIPFISPEQRAEMDAERAQNQTPIANTLRSMDERAPLLNKIPFVSPAAAAGAATLGRIGNSLNTAGSAIVGNWDKTTGQEAGAVPFDALVSNVPAIGLGTKLTEHFIPQTKDLLSSPIRDLPGVGGAVRVAESLGGALNASGETIAKPIAGAIAANLSKPSDAALDKHQWLGKDALVSDYEPAVDFKKLGTSQAEMNSLSGGFLMGTNTPDQNTRLETLARGSFGEFEKENPVAAVVLQGLTDPLTYVDVLGFVPKLSKVQQLRRVWAAAGDVTKAGELVGDAPVLEGLIAKVFQPKSIKEGELLSDVAAGVVKPSDSNPIARTLRAFKNTPTAQTVENVERAIGSLSPYLADEGTPLAKKVQLLGLMQERLGQGKMLSAAELTANGIKSNSKDFHLAAHALGKYDARPILQEYKRVQEMLDSVAQTTKTTRGSLYNPEVAGFAKSQAEGLSKGYKNVFDHVFEGWEKGHLDIEQARAGLERIAGIRLATDLTNHMGTTLAQIAKIPKPNAITQMVSLMKKYEGLVYVGANPGSMVNNFGNDFVTLIRHGAHIKTEKQLDELFARWGMEYQDNIGAGVRQATGDVNAGDVAGAFGSAQPDWTKKIPGLKQLNAGFERSQAWGRKIARATGMERFMGSNFKPPQLTPALVQHFGEDAPRVMRELQHSRNYTEALNIMMGKGKTWARFSDDLADELTTVLSKVAGREMQVTPEILQDALPLATREQFNKTLALAFEEAQRTGDLPVAFRRARAKVYAEDLKNDTFADLFPPSADEATARAKEAGTNIASPPPDTTASVPVLITRDMERRLKVLGYEQGAIDALNPQEAQDILRGGVKANGRVTAIPDNAGDVSGVVNPVGDSGAGGNLNPRPEIEPRPRLNPGDFTRQENALVAPPRTPDPNVLREFATQLAQEPQMPNILRNRVDPADWAQMSANGRQTLLERTLAQQRDAGNFPLSDVYQARGDVPTAMPDVSNIPAPAPAATDLSDVFYAAAQKGVGTADPRTGRTVNQHLFNVLNKHKGEGVARFTTMDDVRARADEAIQILDGYAPIEGEVKNANVSRSAKGVGGRSPEVYAGEEGKGIGGTERYGATESGEGIPSGVDIGGVSQRPVGDRQVSGDTSQLVAPSPVPPTSEGRMTLSGGEPQFTDDLQRLNYNKFYAAADKMKADGAGSVLDGQLNKQMLDALEQVMLDRIEKSVSQEGIQAANVLSPEVEKEIARYLKQDYMPELNQVKQGGLAAGRFFQDSTVLNYDGQWNIETALLLERPFVHWWLHTALNYARDFADHPAMLAYLLHLREAMNKQSAGMPDRFKGKVEMAMPLAEMLGLGDSIWIAPMRMLMPYEDVYNLNAVDRAGYTSVKEDGTVDASNIINDTFGIHTPIKLAMNLLQGDTAELQNTLASIPALRAIRGLTSGLTPGGVSFGLESKYDKFYLERAMKELVAEGTITNEQAQIALLQKGSDPAWRQIQERAGLENYGIKEMTGLFGMRGTAFTRGEQRFLDAKKERDDATTIAVQKLGGNPNMDYDQQNKFLKERGFYESPEWKKLKESHPELDTNSFINQYDEKGNRLEGEKVQEARERDYYIGKLWDVYHAAPELKQKLIAADLGDDFKRLFLDQETKNYDAIPRKMYLGWANALDALLPQNTAGTDPTQPSPYHLTFTTDKQNAAYQKLYDEVDDALGATKSGEGWRTYGEMWDKYYALKEQNKDSARAYMDSPEGKKLSLLRDRVDQFFKENPDIEKVMQQAGLRKTSSTSAPANPRGAAFSQAITAVGYTGYDEYDAENKAFHAFPEKSKERRDYLLTHPRLKRMFDIGGAIYKSDAELQNQGGGSSDYKPFYLRPSYNPRVSTPRQPRHNSPISGQTRVSTRSTYALFAALKRRYPPKQQQGAGQIAYRDGAVM